MRDYLFKNSTIKYFVLTILFVVSTVQINFADSSNVHYIHNSWYNENVISVPREEITSIEFMKAASAPTDYKNTWDIDDKGLKGFLLKDNKIVIYIPENDILKAGIFSQNLFSFYKFENNDYGINDSSFLNSDSSIDNKKTEYKSKLKNIANLNLLDTSDVSDMSSMFYGLSALTDIDLSKFDTSHVANMSKMFYACESLKKIDISSFDTSSVTDMNNMFAECINLEELIMNSNNVRKVTDISYMFYNCEKIKSIDFTNLQFKALKYIKGLYKGCKNLATVSMAGFNTKDVKDMSEMFMDCKNINYIDLSSLDTMRLKKATFMFLDCENLREVRLDSFFIDKSFDDRYMFLGCNNLKNITVFFMDGKKIQDAHLSGAWKDLKNNQIVDIDNDNIKNVNFYDSVYEKVEK